VSLSVRLSEEEEALFRAYAEIKKISVSDLLRQSVIERIEEEFDLELFKQALAEYQKNPVTYTLDEVEKALGIKNV